MLADNGFDVWLGNARGNTYSTNHATIKAFGSREDREKFWTFSWHEIGINNGKSIENYSLHK